MDGYLLNLSSAIAVFCATAWQLALTFQTGQRTRDRAAYLMRGSCLIGIAVGMLGYFLRELARHDFAAPWYVLVMRLSLTVLLVYPWRRRGIDR